MHLENFYLEQITLIDKFKTYWRARTMPPTPLEDRLPLDMGLGDWEEQLDFFIQDERLKKAQNEGL